MNADGFSVKTAISQTGNVARSQQKAQQVHQGGPEQGRRLSEKDGRLEHVREAEKAEQAHVDADRGKKDKDERRRSRGGDDEETPRDEQDTRRPEARNVGRVVDIKA